MKDKEEIEFVKMSDLKYRELTDSEKLGIEMITGALTGLVMQRGAGVLLDYAVGLKKINGVCGVHFWKKETFISNK